MIENVHLWMLYLHSTLIYVSLCFWSWVKDFFQNRQTLWGKRIEPFFFGPLLKCIFDFEYFRYKPHPQFFAKQMRLNLSLLISFVLRSISAASTGKVFNMFCVSDSGRAPDSPPFLTFVSYLWQLVVLKSPCLFYYHGRKTALHSEHCLQSCFLPLWCNIFY